jgi:hypothetical protein
LDIRQQGIEAPQHLAQAPGGFRLFLGSGSFEFCQGDLYGVSECILNAFADLARSSGAGVTGLHSQRTFFFFKKFFYSENFPVCSAEFYAGAHKRGLLGA